MTHDFDIRPAIEPDLQARPPDVRVAELAARQHGVVSRAQLDDCGLGRHAIEHRLANGRLHEMRARVYAVGHVRLTQEGRWMAAVLAGGLDAWLSHRAAGALWGITPSGTGPIEVTASRSKRDQPGIVFRTRAWEPDELTTRNGIPVTAPSRTLLDLAQVLDDDALERALREAERLQLTDVNSVADLLERYPRRRGSGALRRLTAMKELYRGITRSELEERFRVFLRTHGLPSPEWNVRLELGDTMLEVDCLWREQRVVIELDGYGYHAHLDAFERDRLRDRLLQLADFRPIRITWKLLRDDPALARDLDAILAL
jgi:very-short-patch-repair endonuclease